VEVAAYHIVCEAITNVSKHAHATECRVRLTFNDEMQIDIQDNGIGFQPGMHRGVGMFSMRERALELGGTFSVNSNPGSGVHIKVHLPCEIAHDEH
jgi:two-component system NarL family sensor kinase